MIPPSGEEVDTAHYKRFGASQIWGPSLRAKPTPGHLSRHRQPCLSYPVGISAPESQHKRWYCGCAYPAALCLQPKSWILNDIQKTTAGNLLACKKGESLTSAIPLMTGTEERDTTVSEESIPPGNWVGKTQGPQWGDDSSRKQACLAKNTYRAWDRPPNNKTRVAWAPHPAQRAQGVMIPRTCCLYTEKQQFVDLAWPRRDRKTPLPKLEEELLMEARGVLKKDEDMLPLPSPPLTAKPWPRKFPGHSNPLRASQALF